MNISILKICQNCDYWHSGYCDVGMRKVRTVGKGKMVNGIMQGKYLTCNKFSVWGQRQQAGEQP
jgi:hypothetical protein